MKALLAPGLLALLACAAQAQTLGTIPVNAKIYVDPAGGFDKTLTAALNARQVALTITTEKSGADYEFEAVMGARLISGADLLSLWVNGYGEHEVRIMNLRSGAIVYVTVVGRNAGMHDLQRAAEICAERFKTDVGRVPRGHPILDF